MAEIYHTVSACPTGYSWLWVQKESFRVSQTDVNLNGTTLFYKLYNYSGVKVIFVMLGVGLCFTQALGIFNLLAQI